jgi:hypothetical protein
MPAAALMVPMPQLNKIRSTLAVALLGALLAVVAPSPIEAAQPINIVAIAAASDGQGYVMAESDGVVWAYGSSPVCQGEVRHLRYPVI